MTLLSSKFSRVYQAMVAADRDSHPVLYSTGEPPIMVRAAMTKRSAGILLFRRTPSGPEVFLIHPGGPFWAKKDAWSIPKGEYFSLTG
jgi:hypothetical protein